MFPTLFTIGSISISTAAVVLILGFFVSGFAFWRRGKEEHYGEVALFDGFVLSFLVGTLIARLGFIFVHFDRFGFNIGQWFDLVGNSGTIDLFFLIGAVTFFLWYAKRHKWDAYEVLDFWTIGISFWFIFVSLADFFSGSSLGKFTELPWGIAFPGTIQPSHPVQLYGVLFFLGLYWYLSWAESRYRTFDWYRLGRKAAQTGFLLSNFLIFYGFFSLVMLLVRLPVVVLGGVAFDGWIYLMIIFYGVWLLLRRSDKPLIPQSFQRKVQKKMIEREEKQDENIRLAGALKDQEAKK